VPQAYQRFLHGILRKALAAANRLADAVGFREPEIEEPLKGILVALRGQPYQFFFPHIALH
jgi:hypothetical protein